MQEPEKIITKEMLGDGLRRIFEALEVAPLFGQETAVP